MEIINTIHILLTQVMKIKKYFLSDEHICRAQNLNYFAIENML